jgi:hypothetical protein
MRTTILLSVVMLTLALPSVCAAANAIQPVPEPATGLLLLLGGAGAAAYRRYRNSRS